MFVQDCAELPRVGHSGYSAIQIVILGADLGSASAVMLGHGTDILPRGFPANDLHCGEACDEHCLDPLIKTKQQKGAHRNEQATFMPWLADELTPPA